ncbi:hypothetical protein BN129_1988 [Cronobacter sakazakii 701]|nr:hypothetical protein BN129_1988 [Cronobacter sakazakii 701]
MGVGHQQAVDKVFFFNTCGGFAFTAAALRFVIRQRLIFHIALVRQGDHHIFLVYQIFDVDIGAVGGDFSAALVAELVADKLQLFADHFHQAVSAAEDMQQLCDLLQQLFILVEQFFMLKAGELLQTQIEDRLRLLLGQPVFAIANTELRLQPLRTRGVITGALQHRRNGAKLPRLRDEARFRFRWGRRAANQFDNRIDIGQRNRQTF